MVMEVATFYCRGSPSEIYLCFLLLSHSETASASSPFKSTINITDREALSVMEMEGNTLAHASGGRGVWRDLICVANNG